MGNNIGRMSSTCLVVALCVLPLVWAGCGDVTGAEGGDAGIDAGAAITDIDFGVKDMGGDEPDQVAAEDVPDPDDVMPDSDDTTDAGGASACPGGPGCVCVDNAECDNVLCIDVADGKHCAVPCVDTCEDGFTCAPVGAGGGDVVNICVPNDLRLCDPCKDSKACKSLGVEDAACVDQGSEGAFCATGCKTDEQCKTGFVCKSVTTIEGASASMCVPKPADDKTNWGTCECSKAATAAKLSTACFVEHYSDDKQLVGKCPGVRTCAEDGLTGCTAPPLEVEVCDGKDNDCDGKIDEDTCTDSNDCTQSACDPAQGCLVTKLDGVPCDADGDVCTENDSCSKGVCIHGKPKNCDDGNVCTIAVCHLANGCTQTADNGKPCDADGVHRRQVARLR